MIQFAHAYKTYPGPVHALRGISFEIQKGEFAFLTGPSGAGKTTIFKMIAGMDHLSSGEVTVGDYSLNKLTEKLLPQLRRSLGIVFQDFKLLDDLDVSENIALTLKVRGEKRSMINQKVNSILQEVNLFEKRLAMPHALSAGEQQRVAIARAIVHQPAILIADEPTGNLDPKLSEEIIDLLERLNHQGATILVATHNLELVKRRGKRNLSLRAGQIEDFK